MKTITVRQESEDRLTMHEWTFWFEGLTLKLDSYDRSERRSKRNTFRLVKSFGRPLCRSDMTTRNLDEKSVPFNEIVAAEARRKLFELIVVEGPLRGLSSPSYCP